MLRPLDALCRIGSIGSCSTLLVLAACGHSAPPVESSPLEKGTIALSGKSLALGMPTDAVKKVLPTAFDGDTLKKAELEWNGTKLDVSVRDKALVKIALTFPSADAAKAETEKRWGAPTLTWSQNHHDVVGWSAGDTVAYLSGETLTFAPRITGWIGASPSTSKPGLALGKPTSALASLNDRRQPFDLYVAEVGWAAAPSFIDDTVVISSSNDVTGVKLLIDDTEQTPVASKAGERRIRQLSFELASCAPLDKAWPTPTRADGPLRVWQTPSTNADTSVTTIAKQGKDSCYVRMFLSADHLVDASGHFWFESDGWIGKSLDEIDRASPGSTFQEGSNSRVAVQPLRALTQLPAAHDTSVELLLDHGTVCGWQAIVDAPDGSDVWKDACSALGATTTDRQCRRGAILVSADNNANVIAMTSECAAKQSGSATASLRSLIDDRS